MWIVTSHKMSLPSKLPSAAVKALSPRHALPAQPFPFHIYALLARPCQTSAGHSTAVHAEPCRARPALLELRDLKSPIGRPEVREPDEPACVPDRRAEDLARDVLGQDHLQLECGVPPLVECGAHAVDAVALHDDAPLVEVIPLHLPQRGGHREGPPHR